jgi:hypothetical protein
MMSEQANELVNKKIDGLATDIEKEELDLLVQQNEDVRLFHDEMMRLHHCLDGVENLTPPLSLKTKILRAIRSTKSQKSWRRQLQETFLLLVQPSPKLGLAFSFAIGAIVTGVIFVLFSNLTPATLDPSSMVGTLLSTHAPVSSEVTRLDVRGDHLDGVVTAKHFKDILAVELSLSVEHPLRLKVHTGQSIGFRGFSQKYHHLTDIIVHDSSVELTIIDKNDYILLFDRNTLSSPLHVRLTDGQSIAFEGYLTTGNP